jgi:hypothetical protein
MGRALPSSGRRSGSSLGPDPFRNSSGWFLGRSTAPHSRSPSRSWAMHPPTRRISRPPLQHPQPEIPPIEPISAESLAYPPETPVPQLAANISSGSPPPQLDMARNKRTSPPTAKPRRLSTAPGNYAYLSSPAPPSKSARALSGACQDFSMLRACGPRLSACQLRPFGASPRRAGASLGVSPAPRARHTTRLKC